jgi:hypothetical protein
MKITGCFIQNASLTKTHEQTGENNGNIKFLQPYPVVAVDAPLEFITAVVSAVLSLDKHLSQTIIDLINIPVSQ